MAESAASEVREAVQTIAEAAGAAEAQAEALEAAQEATEAAEEAAEEIAEAAMEAERMRVIEDLRRDTLTWREQLQNEMAALRSTLESLQAQVTEMVNKVNTPPQITAVATATPEAEPSLIPAPSTEPQATAAVVVNPESAEAVPPAPATENARPRRMRFL